MHNLQRRTNWTRILQVQYNGHTYEDLGPNSNGVYVLYNTVTGDRYIGSAMHVSARLNVHVYHSWLSSSKGVRRGSERFTSSTPAEDWVCVIESLHTTKFQAELRETELVLKYAQTCPDLLINVRHPLTGAWLDTPRALVSAERNRAINKGRTPHNYGKLLPLEQCAKMSASQSIRWAANRLMKSDPSLSYAEAKAIVKTGNNHA